MKIVIPTTAKKGFIDVWFKHTPVESHPIVIYKLDDDGKRTNVIFKQVVYGSGNSTGVSERYLLKIPCKDKEELLLSPGDQVEIMTLNPSGEAKAFENEVVEIK